MAIRVPDAASFKLSDVIAAVEDHAGDISNTLVTAFANSIDSYFDPAYKGSKDRQSNFRNYGPTYEPIPCGQEKTYNGSFGYPNGFNITLGSATGVINLAFDAYSLPELILVKFDGQIVINTGFRGHSNYDFGGSLRYAMVNTLNGRKDPVHGNTFPDFTNYPNDGYPRVTSPGSGSGSFNKNTSSTNAIVEVYSGIEDVTQWKFTLYCP